MKTAVGIGMAAALTLGGVGCAKISTQVVEKPRVDQSLAKGNRGTLMGTPPEATPRRTTRKIIQADVELATAGEMTPWKVKKQEAAAPEVAGMESAAPVAEPAPMAEEPKRFEKLREALAPLIPKEEKPEPVTQTYIVEKGDTLGEISFKMYGTSKKWRLIYEANRNTLKSPNRIVVGQKLMIPPADLETDAGPVTNYDIK